MYLPDPHEPRRDHRPGRAAAVSQVPQSAGRRPGASGAPARAPAPMALVPFRADSAFANALELEERCFSLCGKFLKFSQDWKADGRGGSKLGFGASVYNAAFVLGHYLESRPELVRGKRVIELGCGPGLLSVVSALLGADDVLATDGDAELLPLVMRNVERNVEDEAARARVAARAFLWGDEAVLGSVGKFDVVLAADVAAVPYEDAYEQLVLSLKALVAEGGQVLLAYQRRHASEDRFFELLRGAFEVRELPREALHRDFRDSRISLFAMDGAAAEERDETEVKNCALLGALKTELDGGARPEAFRVANRRDERASDEGGVTDFRAEDWA